MTVCRAQGVDSLQEDDEFADVSEADRDAMEAREDVRSIFGELVYRHYVMLGEDFYVPKKFSFPVLHNSLTSGGKRKTKLEYSIDGTLTDVEFSLKSLSGSTRFRILNKRPVQGCSRVDLRMTKTQVISRPEVWSSISKCAQKKESSNEVLKNTVRKARSKMCSKCIVLLSLSLDAEIQKCHQIKC